MSCSARPTSEANQKAADRTSDDFVTWDSGKQRACRTVLAFNMNAAGPDVSVLVAGGISGLPQISLDSSMGEPVLQVTFLRRKGSGLVYTPQCSTTSGDFVAMSGTLTVTAIDAQWERVTVREPAPPAIAPHTFARVQVTLP